MNRSITVTALVLLGTTLGACAGHKMETQAGGSPARECMHNPGNDCSVHHDGDGGSCGSGKSCDMPAGGNCGGAGMVRKQQAAERMRLMSRMNSQEMMDRMKKAGAPGAEHAQLQPLVGKWKATTKWWQDPTRDPEVSTGTSESKWIMGKRFIREEYHGKMMGQPFEGEGLLGYDNVAKEYISTWMDTMSTGLMTSTGKYDAASRSLEMTGTMSCPLLEHKMENRMVTRIVNDREHVFEMYDMTPDGKEFKNLEITYKRVG